MNAIEFLMAMDCCLILGEFLCFLTAVIQMFLYREIGMAVASLVLCPCCGFGNLLAFFYGWSKVDEWDNRPLMTAWSVFFGLLVLMRIFSRSISSVLSLV